MSLRVAHGDLAACSAALLASVSLDAMAARALASCLATPADAVGTGHRLTGRIDAMKPLAPRGGAAAALAATRPEAAVETIFADRLKTSDLGGEATMLHITTRLKEMLS